MKLKTFLRLLPLLFLFSSPNSPADDDPPERARRLRDLAEQMAGASVVDGMLRIDMRADRPLVEINWMREAVDYLRSERVIEPRNDISRADLLKETPTSQDNSNANRCEGKTGNPVLVATGEKIKAEADFRGEGLYPLSLERTYRSKHATGMLFGPNWPSSLDPTMLDWGPVFRVKPGWTSVPNYFIFTDQTGAAFVYAYKGHGPAELPGTEKGKDESGIDKGKVDPTPVQPRYYTYTAGDSAAMGELVYNVKGEIVITRNGMTHTYNPNRQLEKVVDRHGTELLRYSYGPGYNSRRPHKLTTAGGQSVFFGWGPSGRVETVTDPNGNVWHYAYEGGMLTRVTSPGDKPDVREYHYEDADKSRLTGITIGGKRYSRYAYYPDGKVSVSALADGVESDTFVYDDKTTTVWNAQGQTTRYTFKDIDGELKVRTISREQTSTCAAASALTEYDANGYVDYTLDWRGMKTDYSYDATGVLREMILAAGTANSHTTVFDWENSLPKTTTFKDSNGKAYASVTYSYHTSGAAVGRPKETVYKDVTTNLQRIKRYHYAFHGNGGLEASTISRVVDGVEVGDTVRFDSKGNVVSTTNAVGHVTIFRDYNGMGQARTVVDANGNTSSLTYHPNGLIATQTASGGLVTTHEYNAARQPTAISYPDGSVTRYTYTAAGRLEGIGNARREYVTRTYDVQINSAKAASARWTPAAGTDGPVGSHAGEFTKRPILIR